MRGVAKMKNCLKDASMRLENSLDLSRNPAFLQPSSMLSEPKAHIDEILQLLLLGLHRNNAGCVLAKGHHNQQASQRGERVRHVLLCF